MAKIQARALSQFYDDGKLINPNDLVEGDTALIKALDKAGVVCLDKASVAYCKEIGTIAIAIKGDGFNFSAAAAAKDLAEAEAEAAQAAAIAEAAQAAAIAEAAQAAE